MPAIQRSEFALALNQVANERGIDPSIVLETVQNAILAAYRKDHPDSELEEYTSTLDSNTGEAHIFHNKKDVTPPGFGRIAAQTAKQVILQKIREKEKEAIIIDYRVRIGTIMNGMVLRFAGPNIIVDIGKAEGVMPPNEQIANEKYHLNQRMAVYLKEIHEGPKGEEVLVSRADNGLLEGLLKREVPEVAQGSVEVKSIEREPGNRAKIAVLSNQAGIDPVGSCVGQKGVRVQAIIQEFNGLEKIDIIQWQENPKDYIMQALSPAKNIKVEIDEENKTAKVYVPQDELSLAIGKDGQNVRLASKLTGYRIEIEGIESPEEAAANEAVSESDQKEDEAAGRLSVSDDVQTVEKKKKTSKSSSLNDSRSTKSKKSLKKSVGSTLDSSENGQASAVQDDSTVVAAKPKKAKKAKKVKVEKKAASADSSGEPEDLGTAEAAKELEEAENPKDPEEAPKEVAEEESVIAPIVTETPEENKSQDS